MGSWLSDRQGIGSHEPMLLQESVKIFGTSLPQFADANGAWPDELPIGPEGHVQVRGYYQGIPLWKGAYCLIQAVQG